MTVGAELARARQEKGLSLEEVSKRTKISVERLDAIERDAIDELPPVLYVQGFVRAYASEVGLDGDDYGKRYLAQFVEPPSAAPAIVDPADRADRGGRAGGAEAPPLHLSRGRTSTSVDVEAETPSTPVRPRRFAPLLLVPALGLIAGILFVPRIFWSTDPSPGAAPAHTAAPVPADQSEPGGQSTAPPARAGSTESAVPETAVRTPDTGRTPTASASLSDVSGTWSFINKVESASMNPFEGLMLGFTLHLEQQGDRVTGRGEKRTENGRSIPPAAQTPITLEGTRDGNHIELRFVEQGARRTSKGTFVLNVAPDGSLRGRFSSAAARSGGSVHATRVPADR